jgi:hypothetical protein
MPTAMALKTVIKKIQLRVRVSRLGFMPASCNLKGIGANIANDMTDEAW